MGWEKNFHSDIFVKESWTMNKENANVSNFYSNLWHNLTLIESKFCFKLFGAAVFTLFTFVFVSTFSIAHSNNHYNMRLSKTVSQWCSHVSWLWNRPTKCVFLRNFKVFKIVNTSTGASVYWLLHLLYRVNLNQ